MKLSPALPLLWHCVLVLQISHGDECSFSPEENMTLYDECAEMPEDTKAVVCILYPTNMLNCSWWFDTLENDAQLSVSVELKQDDVLVDSRHQASAKRVGFISWTLHDGENKAAYVEFNLTRADGWICCTASFEERLNILPPPPNVSVSIQNGSISVTWNLPSRKTLPPHCYDYQLDMGDGKKLRDITGKLQYVEPNVVVAHTYKVRMRSRVSSKCYGCVQWSEWSPTVTVERPAYRLELLVIAMISLGIPMILLAGLLLLRHQRVVKVLFPPIPRPPAKYKHFLEKSGPVSFFHPVPTTKTEEEITEVEDAEQNPGSS